MMRKNIVSLEEHQADQGRKGKDITIEVSKVSAQGLWCYRVGKEAIAEYSDDGPIHKVVQSLTLLSVLPTRVKVRFTDGSESVMGAVGVPIMWTEQNGGGDG
jgi:hypothetical protein